MTNQVNHSPKSPVFTQDFIDSDAPQCLYDGNSFHINEAAYNQIQRVIDLLASLATYSHGGDKREEQLFNTLSFSSDLLEQAIGWNLK